MARKRTQGNLLEGNLEHRSRQAVIWLRGYDHDPGTLEAQVSAISDYECRQVILKNELYYEGYIDPVDVCFTDDEEIAREYQGAGIKVVNLRELTAEEIEAAKPKNIIENRSVVDENAELRKQINDLLTLQAGILQGQVGNPAAQPGPSTLGLQTPFNGDPSVPGEAVQQEKAQEATTPQTDKTKLAGATTDNRHKPNHKGK